MEKYKPVDLGRIRTHSLEGRSSKVHIDDFAKEPFAGASFRDFWDSLPNILFGKDMREVVSAIVKAYRNKRPVVLGMGAHVIKCGLNPVIIELMKRGIVTAVALNGAGPIHDIELALVGYTSEDVLAGLKDGAFGMARETGELIHTALSRSNFEEIGLGRAIGEELLRRNPPHAPMSLLSVATSLNIPVTVHVAIGTDIIHMREDASGAGIGAGSFTDFRIFTSIVSDLSGGVYINAGSSVILPEVFLKALTIAQNIGANLHDFTTVNIDMITHYRPVVNVVQRPSILGKQGIALNGRHELLIPLLAYAVFEELERN
jgi:hypothetical protein